MTKKLTKAQRDLLQSLHDLPGQYVASHYPPFKKLLEMGFITDSSGVNITDAGRAALEEAAAS